MGGGPRGYGAFRNSLPQQGSKGGLDFVFNQQARASVITSLAASYPKRKDIAKARRKREYQIKMKHVTRHLWANSR